jgi:hypothetical protein
MNALLRRHILSILRIEPGKAYYFQLTTQEGNSIKYVRESCSNRLFSGVHHS